MQGAYDKFPDLFRMGILNCRRHLKIQYVIVMCLGVCVWEWVYGVYDYVCKCVLVWFLSLFLMAYQLFLGYLMPKPFS